jgi:hypothetical protein
VYATILTYPYTVEGAALPEGQAPNILRRISQVVAPITSSAFTVREASLSNETESALLTRFIAAMYAANRLLLNPVAKPCAIQAIAAQLGVSKAIASAEYASATDPLTGEVSPGGMFNVNPQGIMNDVMVRLGFGGFAGAGAGFDFAAALVPGPGRLVDYSIRDAAVALYDQHPAVGNCTLRCKVRQQVLV